MRTIPDHPIPTLEPPALTTWTLEVRTITPMFGGSAKTREVDSLNPVRPSSVRGHLRFWWRATAGAGFSNAVELFAAEEQLWGSASVHGLVSVRVETISSGLRKPCAVYPIGKSFPDFGSYPGYALFPFQGKASRAGVEEQPSDALTDVQFKVVLTYPVEVSNQISAAVHSWITFGGVGARTRRGCGSLEMTQVTAVTRVQRQRQSLLTLAPAQYFVGRNQQNPVRAWKDAVEIYRDFHQKEHFARNEGSERNRPGRSRFPEADTIRRLSSTAAPQHTPTHEVRGFPRADLGLPIVFHFKDKADPEDHTLQGAKSDQTRFASPAITKAIAVEGGYAAALIMLDAPNVWENGPLMLKPKRGRDLAIPVGQVNLSSTENARIAPLRGQTIREALIEYAQSRGFTKVRL
jgi:CRISPR-associated protein Cmr1